MRFSKWGGRVRLLVWIASSAALGLLPGVLDRSRADADATLIPTNTARPSLTLVPTLTVPPTQTVPPTAVPLPTATDAPTLIASPAPGPLGGDALTWTPVPFAQPKFAAHFVMRRPIAADAVDYPARNYAYGATDGGGRPVHHGDDYENPLGTPILAAADGLIDYAGADIQTLYGPQPNFYGNVIVIKHPFKDVDGQAVYSLYGHLSQIGVRTGQAVNAGDVIGLVGSAGVAVGAHLHFEVRVGSPTVYTATRNPELWVTPFALSGTLAGRVTDTHGHKIRSALVELQGGGVYRSAETYADDSVPGDTQLDENFATGDLASGYYLVFVKAPDGALLYRNTVYIRANTLSFLDIHLNAS